MRYIDSLDELYDTFGDSSSENLILEGDNLKRLDELIPFYAGKIKVVYIDPPYNTGHTKYRFMDRMSSADWVEFMDDRLSLLKDLLSDDGAIFVSIDDHELFNLGNLMDQIFGSKNKKGVICWEKKYGSQNDSRGFSSNHEYILCYAKNLDKFKIRPLPRSKEMDLRYNNPDNDARGPWKPGDFSVRTVSVNYMYPITLPSGRVVSPPPGRSWCTNSQRFQEMLADNRIWFGSKKDAKPQMKKFLTEVKAGRVPSSLWRYQEVGHTDWAKKELKKIMNVSLQDFPAVKPVALIKRCIELVAGPNDIVLDAFAGSGTTGHAVLELNKIDSGNRKFILIESGAKNDNFCRDLTVERVRRVITGEWDSGKCHGTGGGFSFVPKKDSLISD